MEASISRSLVHDPSPWLLKAKPITVALPRPENSQNSGRGRSPPLMTPKMAVDSGNRPMKTIDRAEVMCCRARADSRGKPTTTPTAITASDIRSRRSGRACRVANSTSPASAAAMAARAPVKNSGDRSATATRVAGSEPLKITTPRSPQIRPSMRFCFAVSIPSSSSPPDWTRGAGEGSHRSIHF